ncbi:histone-lysine N-methyltransferase SETMAR [Trichonephila clavipes]|nr:histone-lysine N-methyltransferase SETMAR [Trichonephila clavipes]
MESEKQNFLFYFEKSKNVVQARKKLADAYAEDVLTVRQRQNWGAKFRSGNFDVEDAPCSGRPVEADKNTTKALIDSNRANNNFTPDTSHKDQTSQIIRYLMIENQEVRVEESLRDFIETKNKTVEGKVTIEIRERFQQLQNLAQKYAFLRLEVILSMDELTEIKLLKTSIKNSNLSEYVYKLS